MAKEEKSDLYWAVVDHARTWIGDDGPFRQIVQKQSGLDGVTVRRIAIAYNVSRGIGRDDAGSDLHADAIAQLVNKARPWSEGLVERANQCLEIARKAQAGGHTSKLQVSAITKFSWFSSPASWTVYDRFVARAMKLRSEPTEKHMLAFYATLQARGFTDLALEIQQELDQWQGLALFGARVLDKLMMLHGARRSEPKWAENLVSWAAAFLDVLPPEWRRPVHDLSVRVEQKVDTRTLLNE